MNNTQLKETILNDFKNLKSNHNTIIILEFGMRRIARLSSRIGQWTHVCPLFLGALPVGQYVLTFPMTPPSLIKNQASEFSSHGFLSADKEVRCLYWTQPKRRIYPTIRASVPIATELIGCLNV